tara:strand:+ start:1785 stop:2504 length:720 start_codon:yes stop_codon:yes gene_type:complete
MSKILRILKNEMKVLRNLIYHRIYISPKSEKSVVDRFHKLYYDSQIFGGNWSNTRWNGVLTKKCPLDLWIYQEIIYKLKPDVIVECGTANGGSALFLASMCDLINKGKIITIDIEDMKDRPQHERIKYLLGSSTSEKVIEKVKELINPEDRVMVILDSDHNMKHVLEELKIYGKLVTKENYIVVEDTNINGNPVDPEFGPGPMEAVNEFLKENKNFVIDRNQEKFYLTFNPRGYLRKIA